MEKYLHKNHLRQNGWDQIVKFKPLQLCCKLKYLFLAWLVVDVHCYNIPQSFIIAHVWKEVNIRYIIIYHDVNHYDRVVPSL